MHAMPLIVSVLAVLAIAYRYYSAFLAVRVVALDDLRGTPAHTFIVTRRRQTSNQS